MSFKSKVHLNKILYEKIKELKSKVLIFGGAESSDKVSSTIEANFKTQEEAQVFCEEHLKVIHQKLSNLFV